MDGEKVARGYCAGVFDLIHVGHVRLFKRAKEKCDYLIVGVLVDELVEYHKGKPPVVPFEERLEMVSSIRYVDEAVKVTWDNLPKINAWNQCHYDLFFSGDDYNGNPVWEEERKQLREVGADIFFFSYTEETSSTKIKKDIADNNLLKS